MSHVVVVQWGWILRGLKTFSTVEYIIIKLHRTPSFTFYAD